MTLLVPNEGEVLALKRLLNNAAPDDCKLKLYTNDVTPGETDTVATYTECVATGYAAKTLTGASWTVATAGGVSTAEYAAQTFTLTAAASCYGYYVTNSAGTTLIYAEKFASVFNIPSGGGNIQITPKITAD